MPIKYIKWGNGKKVLIFLHYFGGAANCWKWVADEISAEFTCIAVNLPGFANTVPMLVPSILNYALLIKFFIKEKGIRKYSLIGHSMGGKIALQLAAIDRKAVKNLVLIAPSPPGMEPLSQEVKANLLKKPSILEAGKIIHSLTCEPLSKLKLDTAINAQLATTVLIRNWWVNIGTQQSVIRHLNKLICTITVLASPSDPAIQYQYIKNKVLPLLKKSTLIEIKNAGHLYPLEVPFCIAEKIVQICQ